MLVVYLFFYLEDSSASIGSRSLIETLLRMDMKSIAILSGGVGAGCLAYLFAGTVRD